MRCPTLAELPPPPKGKTGWPWTEETLQQPELMPDGRSWPKISIVTPSFNQGIFIEETIRSVLLQGYPNLEYIIMDGGSTDRSVDIIGKYEKYISHWESQPDNGQADAIYRGFEQASGDIISWINSDDFYLENALNVVGEFFKEKPSIEWLIGNGVIVDEVDKSLLRWCARRISFDRLYYDYTLFLQPSTFFLKSAFFECGGFDRTLRFCMDYDLFLKLSLRSSPLQVSNYLSAFRFHSHSKTNTISEVNREELKYIRNIKFYGYKKNSLYVVYRLMKTNVSIVFHRIRTAGVLPYIQWILSENAAPVRYIREYNLGKR